MQPKTQDTAGARALLKAIGRGSTAGQVALRLGVHPATARRGLRRLLDDRLVGHTCGRPAVWFTTSAGIDMIAQAESRLSKA